LIGGRPPKTTVAPSGTAMGVGAAKSMSELSAPARNELPKSSTAPVRTVFQIIAPSGSGAPHCTGGPIPGHGQFARHRVPQLGVGPTVDQQSVQGGTQRGVVGEATGTGDVHAQAHVVECGRAGRVGGNVRCDSGTLGGYGFARCGGGATGTGRFARDSRALTSSACASVSPRSSASAEKILMASSAASSASSELPC
jgi:hypothetical protein